MKIVAILFGLILGLLTSEILLRAFPSLISLDALVYFNPGLRSEIAGRMGLATSRDALRLSAKSSDGEARKLLVPAANSVTKSFADSNDRALGATQTVKVDENGLCNVPEKALSAHQDIFMAGDSFTFCTAVEIADTAASKLEKNTGISTYNLGVRGIGPYDYLMLTKMFADKYKPKIVIFNIYEGNDLRDVVNGKRIPSVTDEADDYCQGFCLDSYTVEFVLATIKSTKQRVQAQSGQYDFHYSAPVDGKVMEMNTANRDLDEVDYAVKVVNGELSPDLFFEPMSNFVSWARENNITPIVTYIPSMYTAYDQTVTFSDERVGKIVREFSRIQRKWFADHQAELNYEFIDLTPSFQREAAAGRLTHFPANVHLTPFGHSIVADEIAKRLAALP